MIRKILDWFDNLDIDMDVALIVAIVLSILLLIIVTFYNIGR